MAGFLILAAPALPTGDRHNDFTHGGTCVPLLTESIKLDAVLIL
jgi:hypothetical protein